MIMAKLGELNWDNLEKTNDNYEHKPTALWSAKPGCGVDPLNKAKPINAPGEVPAKPSNEEVASYVLKGANNQWKDSEHLHKEIVSQEQAEQLQKDWQNSLNNFYKAAQAPTVPEVKQELEWGDGKSFNESLTEEERLKRNMYTGE